MQLWPSCDSFEHLNILFSLLKHGSLVPQDDLGCFADCTPVTTVSIFHLMFASSALNGRTQTMVPRNSTSILLGSHSPCSLLSYRQKVDIRNPGSRMKSYRKRAWLSRCNLFYHSRPAVSPWQLFSNALHPTTPLIFKETPHRRLVHIRSNLCRLELIYVSKTYIGQDLYLTTYSLT